MKKINWIDGGKGFLEVFGKSLEYAIFGPSPADAPTIVMLHEGLGCVALWRDAPAQISAATGCGVLVYSRSGYGQSDLTDLPRPLDYMTEEAVAVLPKILEAIAPKQCILLGHSDGATIAAIYAGSVIDHRVRGLVLMAPHFFTEPEGLTQISLAKKEYENSGLKLKLSKYHRDPENAFNGWNNVWLDPNFEDWNVSEVIDYLRIPILAIQGLEDEYGTEAQISELENRSYSPVDVVMLADCGHSPLEDARELTVAEITTFSESLWKIEAARGVPA
jgi:pimeloyl-ACP methyl ester carboxylesterase